MNLTYRWVTRLAIVVALPMGLNADTLYLRNGQRVEGELVSIRNGTIEFDERRGSGNGRRHGPRHIRDQATRRLREAQR